MDRPEALKIFAEQRKGDELVIASVAGVSLELHQIDPRETTLYNVQMSYASPLGLGLALSLPQRKVIVLDGDGSMLMGMSALATIANEGPPNLVIIVFDNECWAATGPFLTATAGKTNLAEVGKAAGLETSLLVRSPEEFREAVRQAIHENHLTLIVAKVEHRKPSEPPPPLPFDLTENTYRFIRALVKEGQRPSWHEVVPTHYRLP